MKVGIITFHWATNYGAVMQAYALQQQLLAFGYDAELIDYIPVRPILLQTFRRVFRGDLVEFFRESRLRGFRREHLIISPRRFYSNRSLRKYCQNYDVYICGSDQIWNESFIRHAERSWTLSYYLDFVQDDRKRISYAVSFGSDQLSPSVITLVRPVLSKFACIGVRENTGRDLLQAMGLQSTVVADPTLLLSRQSLDALVVTELGSERSGVFSYVLHRRQSTIIAVRDFVTGQRLSNSKMRTLPEAPMGICDWLRRIRDSELVITNSYHCVIFSLLFHTPFIAVPVEESNMNDRLATLLSSVGLEDRIVSAFDESRVARLRVESIDWQLVEYSVERMRRDSESFLVHALS